MIHSYLQILLQILSMYFKMLILLSTLQICNIHLYITIHTIYMQWNYFIVVIKLDENAQNRNLTYKTYLSVLLMHSNTSDNCIFSAICFLSVEVKPLRAIFIDDTASLASSWVGKSLTVFWNHSRLADIFEGILNLLFHAVVWLHLPVSCSGRWNSARSAFGR